MTKLGTKRIVLIVLAVVIAMGGVIWAIVANLKPTFNSGIKAVPDAYTVSGNGSAAVMVDNYLYFVGGYVPTSSIKYGDNDYYADGKIPDAAIYRVAIKDDQPDLHYEFDNTYTKDDETLEYEPDDPQYNSMANLTKIADWEDVTAKSSNIDVVVPKIAGHDQTAMWVFGNNLIYTTPHNLLNGTGVLLSNRLDFYCVNLDGKNHRLIYTSAANVTTADFTLWANNTNNIYILINESGTLKKIKVSDKKVTTIAEDITAVAFPQATQYRTKVNNERLSDIYGGVMSYVYYTTARDADAQTGSGNGNLMYRYQINASNDPQLIGDQTTDSSGTTFTPMAVTTLGAGNAQFVFSTKETNAGVEAVATEFHIVTNDMALNDKTDFAKLPGKTLGVAGDTVKIYANGFWTRGKELRRYDVVQENGYYVIDQSLASDKASLLRDDVDNVFSVMGDTVYVRSSTAVSVLTFPAGSTKSTGVNIPLTTTTDSMTGTETTEVLLPLSGLYQSYANGGAAGNNLVFICDSTGIKLYSAATKDQYAYLRMKKS